MNVLHKNQCAGPRVAATSKLSCSIANGASVQSLHTLLRDFAAADPTEAQPQAARQPNLKPSRAAYSADLCGPESDSSSGSLCSIFRALWASGRLSDSNFTIATSPRAAAATVKIQ